MRLLLMLPTICRCVIAGAGDDDVTNREWGNSVAELLHRRSHCLHHCLQNVNIEGIACVCLVKVKSSAVLFSLCVEKRGCGRDAAEEEE